MKTFTMILVAFSLLTATPAVSDWYDTSKRPELWTR